MTVVVADEYPNYSICGIPYYFSGDVKPWQSLAHRTHADLEATGMRLRLNTLATGIDADQRRLTVCDECSTWSRLDGVRTMRDAVATQVRLLAAELADRRS